MVELIQHYAPMILLVSAGIVCFLIFVGCVLLFMCVRELKSSRSVQVALFQEIGALNERFSVITEIKHYVDKIASRQESTNIELHAIAAHFVPRLRTEWDVSEEYYHQEAKSLGCDVESRFYDELHSSKD